MNKTIVFNDVEMSKKEFYDAKEAISLNLFDVSNIAVNNKVKNNSYTSKYFIGYLNIGYLNGIDEINPLCINLPQMSGYVKYFKNGGKSMPFKIKDESVYIKYSQMWNKIKELLM